MKVRKTLASALLLAGLGTSFAANAGDLILHNNTSLPSTAYVNIACSTTLLGAGGITQPGKENRINTDLLWFPCAINASACKADVYATKDCGESGAKPIAVVYLDLYTQQVTVGSVNDKYKVEVNPNNKLEVTLSQVG